MSSSYEYEWTLRESAGFRIGDGLFKDAFLGDDGIFIGCVNLKRVAIPDSVKSLEKSTFKGCKSLEEVDLPNTLTHIGEQAFEGCEHLSEIIIPHSVVDIGERAFANSGLKKITFKKNPYTIAQSAFSGCNNLTTVIGSWEIRKLILDSCWEDENQELLYSSVSA